MNPGYNNEHLSKQSILLPPDVIHFPSARWTVYESIRAKIQGHNSLNTEKRLDKSVEVMKNGVSKDLPRRIGTAFDGWSEFK